MSKSSSATTFDTIWGQPRRTITADTDLELVLITMPASRANMLVFKGEVSTSDIKTGQKTGAL